MEGIKTNMYKSLNSETIQFVLYIISQGLFSGIIRMMRGYYNRTIAILNHLSQMIHFDLFTDSFH